VKRLNEAAQTDWGNSHKLDLTDEGLLRDLGKRSETSDGAQLLAVKPAGKNS
jgi:hypothetical protein